MRKSWKQIMIESKEQVTDMFLNDKEPHRAWISSLFTVRVVCLIPVLNCNCTPRKNFLFFYSINDILPNLSLTQVLYIIDFHQRSFYMKHFFFFHLSFQYIISSVSSYLQLTKSLYEFDALNSLNLNQTLGVVYNLIPIICSNITFLPIPYNRSGVAVWF